ncbi:MAG: PadR family transcriptional regulator [Anaerolineales bacterium]
MDIEAQMETSNPNDQLPLTEAEFHILLVLSAGENHGYAIMKAIEEHPEIGISLGPATLYRTIRRLLERGMIKELEDRPDPEFEDERRRYYRLTAAGRKVMEAEMERLSNVISLARKWQAKGSLG